MTMPLTDTTVDADTQRLDLIADAAAQAGGLLRALLDHLKEDAEARQRIEEAYELIGSIHTVAKHRNVSPALLECSMLIEQIRAHTHGTYAE